MKTTTLRKRLHNPLGFTLVELMLVIALMAILAGLVTPALRNVSSQNSEKELKAYFQNVQRQVGLIRTTYNNAMANGDTPRLAGYNLTSARGMQECLRSSNNNSGIYDIELTTISDAPDPNNYNYIDTIVVCVQFYAKDSTTPIVNAKGIPCSPEQAINGEVAVKVVVVKLWYIKIDMKSRYYLVGGALNT